MVDEIGDVVSTVGHQLYPPPITNDQAEASDFMIGVYQIDQSLFALLDAEMLTAA